MKRIPKLRTIDQCLEEIKKYDSDSAVTGYLIRLLCKNKSIKVLKSGTKYLIDLDNLFEYLGFITNDSEAQEAICG